MKRKLVLLSVLAIFIAMAATGSLAFFTSEGKAHNVITTGGIDIAVQEWADEEKQVPFADLTGIMPGEEVTKIAEIKNTGSADAWVRVLVTKGIQKADGETADDAFISLDLNLMDWTKGEDDYLYYNKALKPGETTAPIFTALAFDSEMGNEYRNATVTVDVAAQGVQSAHNGTTVMDARGWPEP